MKVRGIIIAGDKYPNLKELDQKLGLSGFRFAGKYRLIDFALSNCTNSGILDVAILPTYNDHFLIEYIDEGQNWGFSPNTQPLRSLEILNPCILRDKLGWYRGNADAIFKNLDLIGETIPDSVLIAPGHDIYQMDFSVLVDFHRERGADVTINMVSKSFLADGLKNFTTLSTDDNYRVKACSSRGVEPLDDYIDTGIYIFRFDVLAEFLRRNVCEETSGCSLIEHIIPRMITEGLHVYAYPFAGYWATPKSLYAYWKANMDLLDSSPSLNLNDRTWTIQSGYDYRPSAKIDSQATVYNSFISNGCVIAEGATVEKSVLSPGVYVGPGAVVRESIIWDDCYVEADSRVEKTVVGFISVVGRNSRIGEIDEADKHGIVLIGENTNLPSGITIGKDVIIGAHKDREDFEKFPDNFIPAGTRLP